METFTVDIMIEALKKGEWGLNICDGDNFYKKLFKLEKKDTLSVQEANIICGSCNRWMDKTAAMMEECKKNGARDDIRAMEYGELLMKDVLEHVHKILTTVPIENENFVRELIELAKKME